MPNLSARSTLPEKMDQPGVPEKETQQALRELEWVNTLLGGYNVIVHALSKIEWPEKQMLIMDLGSGGGDVLRAIRKWALKHSKNVKLLGIDRNPVMTEYAEEASEGLDHISFKTLDMFDEQLMFERADIVMSSLFCHHFDDEELVKMVRRMYELAGRVVIINDLHRHWFAYHSIAFLTSLLSKTYLVKYDAKLSVARSLTKREWKKTLKLAGIDNYTIKWRWAWRWEIIIKKF